MIKEYRYKICKRCGKKYLLHKESEYSKCHNIFCYDCLKTVKYEDWRKSDG